MRLTAGRLIGWCWRRIPFGHSLLAMAGDWLVSSCQHRRETLIGFVGAFPSYECASCGAGMIGPDLLEPAST